MRALAGRGIVRRGRVLTWAGSGGDADGAPGSFQDLIGWECFDSSFHLEDRVSVHIVVVDGEPVISDADELVRVATAVASGAAGRCPERARLSRRTALSRVLPYRSVSRPAFQIGADLILVM